LELEEWRSQMSGEGERERRTGRGRRVQTIDDDLTAELSASRGPEIRQPSPLNGLPVGARKPNENGCGPGYHPLTQAFSGDVVSMNCTTSPSEESGREGFEYKTRGHSIGEKHLCAWGNDAASEVIPRRVNCWLKTISKPSLWPSGPPRISGRAPPFRRRESPTIRSKNCS